MVVIAIIGIVSAVILTAMSGDKARIQVEAASREFAARVRQIQNDALTGKYDGSNVACGYIVDVQGGSYSFSRTMNPTCSGVANLCTTGKSVLNTVAIQGGVSVSGPSGVCFTIPFGKANTVGGAPIAITQVYTFSKAGSSRSVCIGSKGDITEVVGSNCS
jgi:type II secretory pathway pseudopilin PulG